MTSVDQFIALIQSLDQSDCGHLRGFFERSQPIAVARAPGRLDVMGGIADYSGSLVLQLPIVEATYVAAQVSGDGTIQIASLPAEPSRSTRMCVISQAEVVRLHSGDYDVARQWFGRAASNAWAAYPAGVVLVLARERALKDSTGLRILIQSDVPEGKGVSSSAALEVATMQAVSHLSGEMLDGTEIARLCQLAENLVVGAPCGIMDQMTSAIGQSDRLLALLCQPAIVQGFVPFPEELAVWGIDSGLCHAVSGSDYTSVRIGALMGYCIIAEAAGLKAVEWDEDGTVRFDDPRWNGYLANVAPREFEDQFASILPDEMRGAEFLEHFGGTTDHVTRVVPERIYAVRQPTVHPIYEHARVRRFAELLCGELDDGVLIELGALMYESHNSYSACELASDGTDRLVELVREAGPDHGLFGARITGGGSGGTVAILGRDDAHDDVTDIAHRYAAETGRAAYVFSGSSTGACGFGIRTMNCH